MIFFILNTNRLDYLNNSNNRFTQSSLISNSKILGFGQKDNEFNDQNFPISDIFAAKKYL